MQPTPSSSIWIPKEGEENWIPDGFVVVIGPDNQKYLMPDFMVTTFDNAYYMEKQKENLMSYNAPGSVSGYF